MGDQPSASVCDAAGAAMIRSVADERPDMYGMEGDGVPMERVKKPSGGRRWVDRVKQKGEQQEVSPERSDTQGGKTPSR